MRRHPRGPRRFPLMSGPKVAPCHRVPRSFAVGFLAERIRADRKVDSKRGIRRFFAQFAPAPDEINPYYLTSAARWYFDQVLARGQKDPTFLPKFSPASNL